MANYNKPTNAWPKGFAPNPNGRPPLDPDIKEARQLNKAEVERLLNKYLSIPTDDLHKILMDKTLPVLEMMICRIVHMAIADGDEKRLDFLLTRLVGKPKEEIKIEHNVKLISVNPEEAVQIISQDPFKSIDAQYTSIPQLLEE